MYARENTLLAAKGGCNCTPLTPPKFATEEAVLVMFPKQEPQDIDTPQSALKADDEQAVRYVAGYVALVLRKKYEKSRRS